ncbi:7TMR-DISM-7TM domain-containing two-component system sensor histidine kinase [Malaciobacter halophilus]|nr:sensor histidine kinase [Malaciobacter halophilus]AXH08802.1 7TMR-DISM-7TM domain-containing two-component system sensor histidine kinase [Malaciobacter halophilus]
MKKIFLILFVFSYSFVFADKFNLIKSFQVSEDFEIFKEFGKKDFLEHKNKKVKKFAVKIELNKSLLKDKKFYLTVVSDYENLLYSNISYIKNNHILISKLDENIPNEITFYYSYDKPKRAGFRFKIISEFEYKNIFPFEGILYGVAYGIIFCAFLYYFIIYFSTRKNYFLYYSIMQIFVLASLIGFVYFSFKAYPTNNAQAIVDIFENMSFIFTLLFAKEILKTEKKMPYANYLLCFFIGINIIDIFIIFFTKYSILYEYMPFYIIFLLPTILGIVSIVNKNENTIIYTIGWSFMTVFIYLAEMELIPLSGIYTIHIVAPMESLIFSFALAFTLRAIVNEKNEKEKLLIHKSKLASMGEMINNIAHQWRQPLTHLSYINMNLQMAFYDNQLNKEYLNEKIEESNNQLEFMSNTIESLSDFYKPQKQKEYFYISSAVKQAIQIMTVVLKKHKINLTLEVKKDRRVYSYENEYSQVVLNLITNAKDVLVQREIKRAKIEIVIDVKANCSITTVCDNAGGIDSKTIQKIFEPYFTTKEKGSGIGLYMSKTIINSHFKGDLKVTNTKEGACFFIEV